MLAVDDASLPRYVRGTDIGFSSYFRTATGDPYTGTSVSLTIAYHKAGQPQKATVAMIQSNGQWIAKWNSASADAGVVEWFVATGGSDVAADEGRFVLVKNSANPGT